MRRARQAMMSLVVAAAVVLSAIFASPAFADETPPPADGGQVPPDPGSGSGVSQDPTDWPTLSVGSAPTISPQVPEGESEPMRPLPQPFVSVEFAPNAPGPYPLSIPMDALAQRDARRAQLIETYGSVEAGAAAEGIDLASLEVPAPAVVDTRAIELRRLAHALHLMVPRSWTWAAGATTLWIL